MNHSDRARRRLAPLPPARWLALLAVGLLAAPIVAQAQLRAPHMVTASVDNSEQITVRWQVDTASGDTNPDRWQSCAILNSDTTGFPSTGFANCQGGAKETDDTPADRSIVQTGLTGDTAYRIAVRGTTSDYSENTDWVEAAGGPFTTPASPPQLTIASLGDATEGTDATLDFTITPSRAFTEETVTTVTLTGADDYVAASERTQTVNFLTGVATARTVTFAITDDDTIDPNVTATAAITPNAAAFTLASNGVATAMITDDDGPAAPTNVSVAEGDASITVTWTAGTAVSGQPAAEGHNVCAILATTPDFPASVTQCAAGASPNVPTATAILTGLETGTPYKIAVRSFENNLGEVSAWVEASGTFRLSSICPTVLASQETVCNLNQSEGSGDSSVGDSATTANSFTVGGTAGSTFDLQTVRVRVVTATSNFHDAWSLEIYDDSGTDGLPGTSLGALTRRGGGQLSEGVNDFDAPAAGIQLSSGETYWLVFFRTNGNPLLVSITTSADEDTAHTSSGWSIGTRAWTSNSGDAATKVANLSLSSPEDSVRFAVVAAPVDSALRLKLRVFLESALP